MTIERFRDMYNAQPFRPFTIHFADGRKIVAVHREFISMSPSGRTVVVHQPDDSMVIIDLLLVVDLEVRNGKPKSNNGSRRRR